MGVYLLGAQDSIHRDEIVVQENRIHALEAFEVFVLGEQCLYSLKARSYEKVVIIYVFE